MQRGTSTKKTYWLPVVGVDKGTPGRVGTIGMVSYLNCAGQNCLCFRNCSSKSLGVRFEQCPSWNIVLHYLGCQLATMAVSSTLYFSTGLGVPEQSVAVSDRG